MLICCFIAGRRVREDWGLARLKDWFPSRGKEDEETKKDKKREMKGWPRGPHNRVGPHEGRSDEGEAVWSLAWLRETER